MTTQATKHRSEPSAAEMPFEPEAEARTLLDDLLSKPSYRLRFEPQNLTDLEDIADMAVAMRLNGCQSKADAKLRMMTGAAIGLPAMASLQSIAPIENRDKTRTTMSVYSKTKLALILQRPDIIEYFRPSETTSTKSVWIAKRRDQRDEVTYEFTWDDAITAGLVSRGSTAEGRDANNYNRHPKPMLTWRCVGRLADIVAGDILHGIATREDLEDERNREPPMPAPVGAAAGGSSKPSRDWTKDAREITERCVSLITNGDIKKASELFAHFEKDLVEAGGPESIVTDVKAVVNEAIIAKKKAVKDAGPKGETKPAAQASLPGAVSHPYLPPEQRGDSYMGPDQPPPGWKP